MPRPLDIACLQTRPMADFEAAIAEALPLAQSAVQSGAKVLFLPEYCGGLKTKGARLIPPAAPETSHPLVSAFQDFAAQNSVAVMIGSVAVPGPNGKILNRGVMIDETGSIIGRYDKIHLFDIELSKDEIYRESDSVSPGSKAVNHEIGGTTIGHTICYDLRFPMLFRDLPQNGAEGGIGAHAAAQGAEHPVIGQVIVSPRHKARDALIQRFYCGGLCRRA